MTRVSPASDEIRLSNDILLRGVTKTPANNGTKPYTELTVNPPTIVTGLFPEEFIATAGQTVFTMSQLPANETVMFRNGVELPELCYGTAGLNITYVPANNGGAAMQAGDRVRLVK